MTPSKRFVIGGLGALSVFAFWAAVADQDTVMKSIRLLRQGGEDAVIYLLGYAVRAAALFLAGGIVGSVFNANEDKPSKLFQLGMVAPAFLAAFLGVKGPTSQSAAAPFHRGSSYVSLTAVAHAQGKEPIIVTKYPSVTVPAGQQFWKGFFAEKAVQKRFYVIVGSRADKAAAVKLAEEYALKFPQFHYVVYEPYESEDYGVSIGSLASYEDAEALKRRALKLGFPDGAFIKAVP